MWWRTAFKFCFTSEQLTQEGYGKFCLTPYCAELQFLSNCQAHTRVPVMPLKLSIWQVVIIIITPPPLLTQGQLPAQAQPRFNCAVRQCWALSCRNDGNNRAILALVPLQARKLVIWLGPRDSQVVTPPHNTSQLNNFLLSSFSPPQHLLFQTLSCHSVWGQGWDHYCMFSWLLLSIATYQWLYNWDVQLNTLNSRHLHVELKALSPATTKLITFLIPGLMESHDLDYRDERAAGEKL